MTARPDIPPDYLRECFDYNPLTGRLTWRDRPRHHFRSHGMFTRFQRHYAGKPTGSVEGEGYVCIQIVYDGAQRTLKAHRVAFAIMTGDWPDGQIDHINGNRADNSWANLRLASQTDNMRNRAVQRRSVTGVSGVRPMRGGASYQVYIGEGGQQTLIGTFRDFDTAVRARKAAERRLGYHPNHSRRN